MSSAEALVRPGSYLGWSGAEWQRLWLSTRTNRREWRSLAVVPAAPGASPQTILQITTSLARTGMVHLGTPIHVADATGITLAQLEPFTEVLNAYVQQGDIVLVALNPLADAVTALPLIKATDAALLCVVRGAMSLAQSKETVTQVGASHFIGSAMFDPTDR